MNKLNAKLAEILDENIICDDTNLIECENMDSLSVLSIVSMVDNEYGIILKASEIKNITTSRSLMDIILSKK